MFRFPSIQIQPLSFWLGFLGGALFWWLINQIKKLFPILKENLNKRRDAVKARREAGVQAYFLGYYKTLFEESHIAVDIFPFSKVFVKPEYFAPAPPPSDDLDKTEGFMLTKILPYIPECPDVMTEFGWPLLKNQDVLNSKNHFSLIGPPGTGKTTALLSLSIEALEGSEASKLPLYLNYLDILRSIEIPIDQQLFDSLPLPGDKGIKELYKNVILSKVDEGEAVLILDGLDELSHQYFKEAVQLLSDLLVRFPKLQIITSSPSDYIDGLANLPITPLGLMTWKPKDINQFADKWVSAWNETITPNLSTADFKTDIIQPIVSQWIKSSVTVKSPLEISLYLWGVLARDLKGSTSIDTYEAYLFRKIDREKLLSNVSSASYKIIADNKSWFDVGDMTSTELSYLVSSGLLFQHKSNHFSFIHVSLLAYIASLFTERQDTQVESSLPVWATKIAMYRFSPQMSDSQRWFDFLIEQNDIALNRDIIYLAEFIRDIPEDSNFRTAVMKKIIERVKNESLPYFTRIQIVSACSKANEPGLAHLFKQLLSSSFPTIRRLGLIGIGLSHQDKSLKDITALLSDKDLDTRHLAIFTLIPLDSTAATQLLAELLLNGSEEMRFAAAQSFAKLGGEGYEVLQEAATVEDIVTRRAAVIGLQTIRENWARDLLEKISMEDGQWVVRNAAARAVESVDAPYQVNASLPIWEQPWLIEFASKQGVGVIPGEDQTALLLEALKRGLPSEKILALQNLTHSQEEGVISEVYKLVFGEEGMVRSEANRTLWLIAASGSTLPPLVEYGFG